MSRIRNAWRALMGAEPEAAVTYVQASSAEDRPQPSGVLFGLNPPDGHIFQVELSVSGFWHVKIFKGDYYIDGGCERAGVSSDEEAIAAAARDALEAFARRSALKARKARFEGSYPPKRIGVAE